MKKLIIAIALLSACKTTKTRYCTIEITNCHTGKQDTIKQKIRGGICISTDSTLVDFKNYVHADSVCNFKMLDIKTKKQLRYKF